MNVRTTVKSIQDIMWKDVGVDGDAQRISQLCWMIFLKIIDDQDQELDLTRNGYRSPIPERFQWRNWAADPEGLTGQALLDFINDELFPALKGLQLTGKPGDRRRVVRDVFEDAYNYMKSGQLLRQVLNKINGIDFNTLADRQHFGDIYEQILNDLQSAGNAGEFYTPRAVTAFMTDRIDAPFLAAMDELFPKPEDAAKAPAPEASEAAADGGTGIHVDARPKNRPLGRPHGTLFLVDVHTREVLWSTYLDEADRNPNKLHKQARNVVERLRKHLNPGL